jgi:hypothetical protein
MTLIPLKSWSLNGAEPMNLKPNKWQKRSSKTSVLAHQPMPPQPHPHPEQPRDPNFDTKHTKNLLWTQTESTKSPHHHPSQVWACKSSLGLEMPAGPMSLFSGEPLRRWVSSAPGTAGFSSPHLVLHTVCLAHLKWAYKKWKGLL